MAYTKNAPVWAEGVAPGISAARLNHLETQYDEAAADLVTHAALDTGVHGAGGDVLATDADIATHAALSVEGTHGSTTAATANKLVHRDAAGRGKVVAPAVAGDIALKSTVTTDIATHAALDTGVHGSGGDVLATDADIATAMNAHKDLDTGVHGAGASTLATIADVAAKVSLTVADTEVFNGITPVAWANLDLSGTIGANAAVVILKVKGGAGAWTAIFRKDGDTDEHYAVGNVGANVHHSSGTSYGLVIVHTSAVGVVEWKTSAAITTTVDVVAYLK